MYYEYTCDICKCIMCHDNKIFESLNKSFGSLKSLRYTADTLFISHLIPNVVHGTYNF